MSNDDTGVTPSQLSRFAQAFAELATQAHQLLPRDSAVAELVKGHLGVDPAEVPTVGHQLPAVELPNLQLALDAILAEQPDAHVIGLSPDLSRYGISSLSALLVGLIHGPSEPVPPVYNELPIDVNETLDCVAAGLWLITHDDVPVVVGLLPGQQHGPPSETQTRVEVVAKDPGIAQAVMARLHLLRSTHNVYRSKVLSFSFSQYGEFGINFIPRPTTAAEQVILPDADLASIQRHTIGMSRLAEQMRAAGRHLKRGLLLYGPPGTGKTHTVGYLMSAMPERTTVVLQGPSVGALGQAAAIVRTLTPSMLVIEDVDLIASERGMPGMHDTNPLMFQLLNEMDGLAETDDVLFVLTTNRLDLLEPALAARPGRVDHAVEIKRPTSEGRRELLGLYLQGLSTQIDDVGPIIARTAGVTASFIKELVRRATYTAIEDNNGVVTDAELQRAVDELLDHALPMALDASDGDAQ